MSNMKPIPKNIIKKRKEKEKPKWSNLVWATIEGTVYIKITACVCVSLFIHLCALCQHDCI